MDNNALEHHGIEGQKWGVRRGPPYPLNGSKKSSKRTKKKNSEASRREKEKRKAARREARKAWWDAFIEVCTSIHTRRLREQLKEDEIRYNASNANYLLLKYRRDAGFAYVDEETLRQARREADILRQRFEQTKLEYEWYTEDYDDDDDDDD